MVSFLYGLSVFSIPNVLSHLLLWEIRKVAVSNLILPKSLLKTVPQQINGNTPRDFKGAKILSIIWNKEVIFPNFHNNFLICDLFTLLQLKINK